MTEFQKSIQRFDERTTHHFTLDRDAQTIDISKLSAHEREYFVTAISDTLRCYIDSMDQLDLRLVNTAMGEAFEGCRLTRRKHASNYILKAKQNEKKARR